MNKIILSILFLLFSFGPLYAEAEGLAFSITPSLFDLSAVPGQSWRSTIKVVNENSYELSVYAEAVNFEPQGERGQGTFSPVDTSASSTSLAAWMNITKDPIVIPPESSADIPILIKVPEEASPGGHYAAVMIGTKPPKEENEMQIKTSQIITSLFFLRVAGDVIEKGEIRTFRADHWFATKSEMSFSVRFENEGTVHLQPQGEIVITNMWGKERGIIPINQEAGYGNVLPQSIRQYAFTWKGEPTLLDVGLYRGDLTLGYGQESKQFVNRSSTFWVVPIKPVLFTVGFIIFAVWFISRSIKAYVRYMLRMSGVELTGVPQKRQYIMKEGDLMVSRPVAFHEPVKVGYLDLKQRLAGVTALVDVVRVIKNFVVSYQKFFTAVLVFLGLVVLVWWFVSSMVTEKRHYEVTIESNSAPVTISSEAIIHDKGNGPSLQGTSTQDFKLVVVNASKKPGAGGEVADILVGGGYSVDELTALLDGVREVSAVIYDPAYADEALMISEILGGILMSAQSPENADQKITVYVGNDYQNSD